MKTLGTDNKFGDFCDWGIVFSLCALIFVLSASIALLDSFAALAVSFYLLKKINHLVINWPLRTSHLNFLDKIRFIWKGFAPPVNILNRPLQFLTLAMFISVLFSQYPALSLLAFMGKFLKCVFLYFSFIEAFSDQKRIHIFLKFFMLSAFITALSGLVQHYTGTDFLRGHLISGGRVNSSFFSPNGFGAYLLPVIGLVAHFLYTTIARHRSWILGVGLTLFLVLLLACLCWTYSRSSWIGFLAIFFVMALLDWRKILFPGTLLLIFIFIFLPSLYNVRQLFLINDSWYAGSAVFAVGEFKGSMTPETLIKAIKTGGSIDVPPAETSVESLNKLLEDKYLYRVMTKRPYVSWGFISRLEMGQQLSLLDTQKLNRSLIEANYPLETPKKKKVISLPNIQTILKQGGWGRYIYWKKAISIIRSSPVYGTGLNTYSRVIRRDPDRGVWLYVHNCYLQLAAETGLVGLACFLWMLFVLLRHSLNYCKQMNDLWPLTFLQGAVSGLFGFLVQSFFDNTFYTVQLGVLMWLIFGLMVAVIRLTPDPRVNI